MAAKSRMPMWIGLGIAGAGGYYLYSAGGDPKKATRKFEDDAHLAKTKIRGQDIAGKAEEAGERAGAKVGEAVDNARDKGKQVDHKATQFAKEEAEKFNRVRKDAAKDVNAKIDSIDKTVEEKAAEAKSGVSSWFGGKK